MQKELQDLSNMCQQETGECIWDWIQRVLDQKGEMSLDKELFIRLEILSQDRI